MSQTKIITFLGTFAKPTTYSYQDQLYTGKLFAEALHQFCDYDQMLVCTTEEAKSATWPILEELNDSRIKAINIPTGRTNDEMWDVFKKITQEINENDQVIFDITHGLRMLPFLVFLFSAYLKAAKNVTIKALYYGAFGLKINEVAPVLDLSEFVSMIDWITATTRFVKIGDGQPLAELLETALPSSEQLKHDPESRISCTNIKNATKAIKSISLALGITRPIEAMKSSAQLEKVLTQAATTFEERAKPFSLLSDKVLSEYGQFAIEDPKNNLKQNLQNQLLMIDWYLQRNQVVQAVTLGREWIISVLVLKLGLKSEMFNNKPSNDHPEGRFSIEEAINIVCNLRRPPKKRREITPTHYSDQLNQLDNADEICNLWDQMTQLRNDIAHVGMNRDPRPAQKLQKSAQLIYPDLVKMAETLL